MGKSERHFGNNDHWTTSPVIWSPIVEHFGGIALDPCSSLLSGVPARVRVLHDPSHSCRVLETEAHKLLYADGLKLNWLVWLSWAGPGALYDNCPYSNIGPWAAKHAELGAVRDSFLLIPARTGAGYYDEFIWPSVTSTLFISRNGAGSRIFEIRAGVPPRDAPPWHSCLHYWGTKPELFRRAFQHLGRIR